MTSRPIRLVRFLPVPTTRVLRRAALAAGLALTAVTAVTTATAAPAGTSAPGAVRPAGGPEHVSEPPAHGLARPLAIGPAGLDPTGGMDPTRLVLTGGLDPTGLDPTGLDLIGA